jgi:protein subunit release factor A
MEGERVGHFRTSNFKEADFSDFRVNIQQVKIDSVGFKYVLTLENSRTWEYAYFWVI